MKSKRNRDISVIVILYNTPLKKIISLKQYKNFRLIILEQGSILKSKKEIQKLLGFKFRYYHSKKNLGLSKGINFLIKKTKTKYCMITEPDIIINESSILKLKKTLKLKKDFLLVGPNYSSKKILTKYRIVKNIDTSCVLFDRKKILKFNFYDEDFFFFWQDVDLVKRINNSKFKMIINSNSFAKHFMSGSSNTSIYINLLREKGYKYGELIFDYKYKKLRTIKILRQLVQSSFRIFFYFIILNKGMVIRNFGYFLGIFEFFNFILKKNLKNFFNFA